MIKRWPLLTTVACVALVTSACSSETTSGVETEKTAIGVEVETAKNESLDAISSLTGTLIPSKETNVSFEVGGNIKKMNVDIGDQIQSGKVLTSLNASDYEIQVKQADNAILQAKAALTSSDAAIDSAKVGIDSAERGIDSAEMGINSSEMGINSAEVGVRSAGMGIVSSEETIKSSQANVKAAEARIKSAQASLDALNKGAREQEKKQSKLALERAETAYNKLKVDASRIKSLYDEGLATKKDYEDINLQVANAKKDVENAEQSYSLVLEGATEEQKKQVNASIEEAKAGKEQAEAGVGQSNAAKGQAIAAKEQAIAAKEQAVAAKGQATATKGQAMSSKEQAIATKEQAVASKGQAETIYEQAMIGKEQAQLTMSKTNLTSPISGVVLEKLVSEGQHVSPGDVVYKLGSTNELKVLLPVPDKEIKDWKVGDQVAVTLYDKDKKGKISKVYPQTNASTGTISVEVLIPNEKLDWIPGQIVKANRVTNDNKGILIPIEAVQSSGSKPYVFKEFQGHALKVEVETGSLVDNKIHIIKGIKEGDRIVTRGGELLLDGDPLQTNGGKKE